MEKPMSRLDDEKAAIDAYEHIQIEKTNTTWDDRIPIDPALDKIITRKFDRRVVPWLFGLWLLAFIDRSNIGNARIDGLTEDLHLTGNKFNIALTIFYVP
ncbi:hypothetical protein LTR28_000125, partial [Elasticomyces elasticus]